ncbi:winged helix-turn-helix transcriptional regulator [Burkholderia sp. R-69608]|nr:winged helix-turn-helix transcriptional regulator [Burkholderia sp. R-69608]
MHTHMLLNDDCFAVRQAARQISQLYDRHLAEAGITPSQFSILTAVSLEKGQTMQKLARTMVMERTTVVRALQPLLKSGYIVRVYHEGGRRRLTLEITDSGVAKQTEAAVFWKTAQAEFERRFGTAEAWKLRKELFRVTSDLCDDG